MSQPYCRTVSLTKVHFLDPQPDEILLEDIAFHLAGIARFNAGIRPGHYSVAEHSILLSHMFPGNILLQKYALIHDAAEFVFGDLAAAIKLHLPDYRALIKKLEDVIYIKFGLDPIEPPELKEADKRLCGAEMVQLRGQLANHMNEDALTPFEDVPFMLYERGQAETEWLLHFHLYWGNDAQQYILGNAAPEQ